MLIRASDLSLASRSERTVERRHEERVLAWVGDRPQGAAAGLADPVSISKAALVRAQAAFAEQRPSAATPGASASVGGASGASSASEADDPAEDPRTRVWRLLIEALTGEKIVAGKFHVDRRGAAGVTGQGAATGQGQEKDGPKGQGPSEPPADCCQAPEEPAPQGQAEEPAAEHQGQEASDVGPLGVRVRCGQRLLLVPQWPQAGAEGFAESPPCRWRLGSDISV